MIQFEQVTKIYEARGKSNTVLDAQSFTIQKGESLAILGRNGAGKSTLLRLIAGIEHPSAGSIRRKMSVSWPIGFASPFQSSLSGADNTRFIARIFQRDVAQTMDFVEEFAELGRYFRMPVRTYSSGMMARLAFAASLAIAFDCYLVDEVTAAGDARFQARCAQALAQRRAEGSLIMVSHDPGTLRQYCQRGAVLDGGHLHFFEDVNEAIEAQNQIFFAQA